MLCWFGIIAATHCPLYCGRPHPGALRDRLRSLSRALTFDAAVAIFSCGSDVQFSWRDLQKYNDDNK